MDSSIDPVDPGMEGMAASASPAIVPSCPSATGVNLPAMTEEEKRKKPEAMSAKKDTPEGQIDYAKKKKPETMSADSPMQKIMELESKFEIMQKESAKARMADASRIKQLELANQQATAQLIRANRQRILSGLAQEGISLNVNEELELCMKQNDDDFSRNVTRIRKNYARNVDSAEWIPGLGPDAIANNPGGSQDELLPNRLNNAEKKANALAMYAKDHPELVGDNGIRIMDAYLRDMNYRKRFQVG
jgi:hypothetical protein